MEEDNKDKYQIDLEEEINLLDYLIVLLKHKWMIISLVVATGTFTVIYSLLLPNIYRSECTIAPIEAEKTSLGDRLSALGGFGAMIASQVAVGGSGSLEKFEVVLKSRELTNKVVQEHNLLPLIFPESWDKKALKGKNKMPSLQDAYRSMQDMLKIEPNKKSNVLKLSFEYADAGDAQRILHYYVTGLSEFLRQQTLENAAAQRDYLRQQLAQTSDSIFRTKLAELLAQQIEKEALARVQKFYGFDIIDPPFIPEKKFKPKRRQICLTSVLVAFFMAVFLAFFMEYTQNLKKREDPERLEKLKKSLRLRSRD